MLSFTLRHCEYFEAVAETGGIAQAAQLLGISQPAVAQGIDRLEERTGLVLFHRRHARGADLTVQGRAFRLAARRLLASAAELEREALALAANLAGILRIGCFHTLAPFCMAALARGYRERRPDVVLETSEHRHDVLVSALLEGQLDLVILYDMDLPVAGMWTISLARLAAQVLLPAGHPLARHKRIRLADLANEPFILFEGAGSSDYFRGIVARQGINPPVAMRCQSMESVRSAVGNGLGFSFTVMRTASEITHDGHRVVVLPIDGEASSLDVVLAGSSDSRGSALVKDFSEYCSALFRQLMPTVQGGGTRPDNQDYP